VKPDAPQTPGLFAHIVERSSLAKAGGTALGIALTLAVAVVSAWLVTPGALTQRLPGDEALGTPALGTFTAARDYDIQDDAATREQYQAASAAERPVFDADEGALDEVAARVRAAFSGMREALAEERARQGGAADGHKTLQHRDDLEERLGVPVGDEDFNSLADGQFSEELEGDLVGLVGRGLAGDVVEDLRGPLDSDRGVVVRALRRGMPQSERILADTDQVRSVHAARDEVQRAAGLLTGITSPQRLALGHMAAALLRPTLVFDLPETARRQQDAADRVKPVFIHVKRGEKIIGDGETIEKRHLLIFRGIRAQTRTQDVLLVRLGAGLLVTLLVALLWGYARRNARRFQPRWKDPVLLAAVLLGSGGLAMAGLAIGDVLHDRLPRLAPEVFFYLVPYAVGALVVRSVLSAEVALLFAVASGALVGLVAGSSIVVALYVTLTSVLAAGLVPQTRTRAGLFRAGAAVGGVGALLVTATHLFTGRGLLEAAVPGLASAASGLVLLPVLAMVVLPAVQGAFGYLTDLKLLELVNLNHPALKDLIIQAPGTYHHAVIMGALAEAAAKAIGANPLLARVGAYYHDIGKIRNPVYFGENQRAENRHEQLAPSMSALIVKRHVTDGVEVARHWKLPREIVDIIRQHHGTRHVSFFWAMAQARATEGAEAEVEEAVFRYAGPKPQTREAAIVMIADACEASARALPDPTRERLRALVQKRIQEIFTDGQFDACDLTLRDLDAITSALATALEAVYHHHPDASSGPLPTSTPAPALTGASGGAGGGSGGGPLQLVGAERRKP
jgi:putative nucleotidyltransferase with HDIG domain